MSIAINDLPRQRILSVDAFRGVTFVLMLIVNYLAGATGIPDGIHHTAAAADGMHLADVVFPAFLFAVGMSIPFGLNSRLAKGDSLWRVQWHVLYRALALVVMGVFMVNAEGGYNEAAMIVPIALWSLGVYAAVLLVWGVYRFENRLLERALRGAGVALFVVLALLYRGGSDGSGTMAPQWWGILGLIGWAYLIAGLAYQATRGRLPLLLAALALCVLWFALGLPGTGHAVHAAIVLAGVVCALLVFERGRTGGALRNALLFAGALALAGLLSHRFYPVSKIYATPSWALYCSAICVAAFALLHWLIERRGHKAWCAIVEPAATSGLITYLLPFVLGALMALAGMRWPAALLEGAGALVFAPLFALAVVFVVARLNSLNVKLKI